MPTDSQNPELPSKPVKHHRKGESPLKKVPHLIRYFLLIAVIVFAGYYMRLSDMVTFLLIGPPLVLAYQLKSLIGPMLELPLPEGAVNAFVFILPVTLFYFITVGIFLKKLFNERGFIRNLSLIVLFIFLIFIHLHFWNILMTYQGSPF